MKLVKVCGIRTVEDAEASLVSAPDLFGMILVPNRARTVELEVATSICDLVKRAKDGQSKTIDEIVKELEAGEFQDIDDYFNHAQQLLIDNAPFVVGVFRNQPIAEVFKIADSIGIDIIQLHGNENKLEYCKENAARGGKYGIISRYVIPNDIANIYSDFEDILIGGKYLGNGYLLPLLDSDLGGEGKVLDWSLLDQLKVGKYLLAGGLNPDNVTELNGVDNIIGFDVSSGVESRNVGYGNFETPYKDSFKVKTFVDNSRSMR